MEGLKIVLFAILAAVIYGILHDQITAHVCVEYFTIGHPPLFATQSPFWLAIGWGIVATWWVGLPLGMGLAGAARAGHAPKLSLADLRRNIGVMMLATGAGALLIGAIGAVLASAKAIRLAEPLATRIPAERHVACLFDGVMHSASYGLGVLFGLALIVHTFWRRRRG